VYRPTEKRKYHQILYTIVNAGNSTARITSARTMTRVQAGSQNYDYPKFPPIIYPHREIPNSHILVSEQSAALKEVNRTVDVFVEISYTDSENTQYFTREKITVFNTGEDISTGQDIGVLFYTAEIDPQKSIIPEKKFE
jgi:hypothetical protein